MTEKIRIGTRGSKLALWQAYHVADLLKANSVDSEIIKIDTKGDKIQDVSIAKIGSKGVFTEEIEEQLKHCQIDIAVHSAKDMQSVLPKGFELIAYTEREVVNDVLVSKNKALSVDDKLVIGTSSTRRVAILKRFYPHIETVAVRGNLQTRIRKMEEGACDALLLAYAGVHRLGYEDMIIKRLSLEEFTPAVGQGSVAVEVSTSLDPQKKALIKESVNHKPTEYRLLCERAFLRKLEGGCSIPVFGLAELNDSEVTLKAGIVSLDGKEIIVQSKSGLIEDGEKIGHDLAVEILEAGGDRMLKDIRDGLG